MILDDNLIGIISGIQHPPKIYVDYLSHDWKKENIWTSWKVMSKQKQGHANDIRLENASWRTWAKQKYNLKTVDPDKLNWLKENDITWLYGPAWSNNIEVLQTVEDKLNLKLSFKSTKSTKSCLKKKSKSEVLFRMRYGFLVTNNSNTRSYIKKKRENNMNLNATTLTSKKSILLSTEKNVEFYHHRKIQFNDHVEQCIAIDNEDYISEDDEIEMNHISLKKKRKNCSTISKLSPTRLKEDRIYYNEYFSLYSNSASWNYFKFFF